MSNDIPYVASISLGIPNLHIHSSELENYMKYEFESCLNHCSRSLTDFGIPLPLEDLISVLRNRLLMEEKSYNRDLLAAERDKLVDKLNNCQRNIFNLIIDVVTTKTQELIFVYGQGGTGKTFLWKTIIYALRAEGKIVLAVASSGIASLLLPSGRTALMTSNNFTFIASFIPTIMEYLVKISKKARILELKRRHLKITCMTRSLTKELLTPFKDPKREFRSSRKLFKTLSLDESRSPVYNLFSDLEENSEKEVTETMAETMKQYMSKSQADYGSGIARPKINDKDHFELKVQFLKELRDNTFNGSDHEDANEHIEKVLKIVNLFHVPNITQDQVMLRVFPMSLTGAASRWLRNKPSGSIKNWEDLKTKFLSKYCPPALTAKKMEEINNF
ncbi:RNA-directed DNA polymerase, eukaryota, reverse transcriptase zinc-binding domain protein [Tanacetum coccineum]